MLWIELILLAMSSVPLQVAGLLIEFGGVSCQEYLCTHFIVTFLMTLKNCICGYLISNSLSKTNILIFSIMMVSSSVIPTLSAIYVYTRTLWTCVILLNEKKNNQDEFKRILSYEDISPDEHQGDEAKGEKNESLP